MNRNEIKAHLRKLPVEASVAFAVRVGLRVLPWLAQNQTQVLMAWKEKDRATHLLAVLFVYDVGLMAALNRNVYGLRQIARVRRSPPTLPPPPQALLQNITRKLKLI